MDIGTREQVLVDDGGIVAQFDKSAGLKLWEEVGKEMECLEGCELQEFKDKKFYCTYYEKGLVSEIGVVNDEHSVLIYRCQECIDEGIKGINSVVNNLDGIRKSLVYLGDHFYSFKDEFEENMADLYRYLKRLEKET